MRLQSFGTHAEKEHCAYMVDSMLKRLALAILPEMHHGIADMNESPEASAHRLARKILRTIREPTNTMIEAGEAVPRNAGTNATGVEFSYAAMIDAALQEGNSSS